MKRNLSLFAALLIASVSTGQNHPIHVELTTKKIESGFKGLSYGTFNPKRHLFPVIETGKIQVGPNIKDGYTILSAYLDREQYFFQSFKTARITTGMFADILDFDTSHLSSKWLDNVASILYGKDTAGNKVLIVDANNNEDFRDDAIYRIPGDTSVHKYSVVTNITIEYNESGRSLENSVPVCIATNDLSKENEWYWYPATYKQGNLLINGKSLLLALQARAIYRREPYYHLYIDINQDTIFETRSEGNESYGLKDTFSIENISLLVSGLSLNGNTITVTPVKEKTDPKLSLLNNQAPPFEIIGVNGEKINLSSFSNKYLLMDFWGTWCAPCIEDLPYLKEAAKKYTNLAVLGIACNDDKKKLLKYLTDNRITWKQTMQTLPGSFTKKFHVESLPAVFLISPSGEIIATGDELRRQKLLPALEKIINRK